MKKFIIERDIPGAGQLSASELRAIAEKSCSVIDEMNLQYHWIQTYVTANKLYCIHIAPDEDAVRQHAQQGGFPITTIFEVKNMIDPTSAENQRIALIQYTNGKISK